MANRDRQRARQQKRKTENAQIAPPPTAVDGPHIDPPGAGRLHPARTGIRGAGAKSMAKSMAHSEWQGPLDRRRIAIFLLFAFGIAWAVAAYIYWTGGLLDRSPDDTLWGLPTVVILLAVVYMGAPTFANLLTRLVTREPWENLWLAWNFRAGWRYWAIAWVLPGVLTIVGGAIFFALFPHYFDAEFTGLQAMIEAAGPDAAPPAMSLPVMILVGALQGILMSPLINGPATFGEEFGWRGYLLQKLMPLGWRPASLWMGLVWGVWHWPILAMGHNYGLEYPGAPWTGMLLFVWFAFCAGTILGWLTLRGRSVWPAVIGHAAINGIAALGALMVIGEPNPLLGPLPVGIVGMIGFSVVGLWMFWRKP